MKQNWKALFKDIPFATALEVRWKDACSMADSYYKGGEYLPDPLYNVGYFMEVNDEAVVLASSMPGEDSKCDEYRDLMVIPLNWVEEVYQWV